MGVESPPLSVSEERQLAVLTELPFVVPFEERVKVGPAFSAGAGWGRGWGRGTPPESPELGRSRQLGFTQVRPSQVPASMTRKYCPSSCNYFRGLLCCHFLIMGAIRCFLPSKFCFVFESTVFLRFYLCALESNL